MIAGARTVTLERRLSAIPTTAERPRLRAVLALARIETRKLVLHPAFLAGFTLLALFMRVLVGGGAGSKTLALTIGGVALGLLAGTLLAANACALRARRDRMGELFGSLPAPPETRTAAILLGVLAGPVCIGIILMAVAYPVFRGDADLRTYFNLVVLAQYPLTVAALGALGVALARWIPHPAAGAVAIVFQVMSGINWVVPWISGGPSGIRMGWHYAYLLSAIAFWGSFALARDRRRAAIVAATVVAGIVMVASVKFQVPPGGLQ